NHRLVSVMVAGAASNALVDGKVLMKIGDQLDGFKLIAVRKNAAIFANDRGGKVILGFRNSTASLTTASAGGQ
ncbi:MAG TPA: hypothetical protein VG722_02225, partial [Tepidisphaeraceae bacterium]|nr:hypothetical protein [Tepidisphaeraceae bacterium]